MIKWQKLVKQIPYKVDLGVVYEILWADEIVGEVHRGETRLAYKQIVIAKNMTARLTVETYLHEVLHGLSNEYDLQLTETQICSIEKCIYKILKPNNLFIKDIK